MVVNITTIHIHYQVVTILGSNVHFKSSDVHYSVFTVKVLYDIQLIFSRVIGIQASSREVNFKDVLSYELAPIPTALFDDSGKTLLSLSFVHMYYI